MPLKTTLMVAAVSLYCVLYLCRSNRSRKSADAKGETEEENSDLLSESDPDQLQMAEYTNPYTTS